MPVDQQKYRAAMARLGTAVNVITTKTGDLRDGFTASAVCSVTDTPPTLLVCINRASRSRPCFVPGGPVCVNALASNQRDVSDAFAGKLDPIEKFAVGRWDALQSGAPLLLGSAASFACALTSAIDVGTHSVLFCEVEETFVGAPQKSLMYLDRAITTCRIEREIF
jgi:flavin reductase